MNLDLKGKKAIVTGGTRGIGRAIAETLADEGCDVGICARHEDQVVSTVESLKEKGVSAIGGVVDIRDGNSLKSWIKDSIDSIGGLDILVSSAGAMAMGADEVSWEKNMRLDMFGAINAVEASLPFLEASAEKNGDAAIVAIGSAASTSATSPSSYGAVKGALVYFIKGVSKQYAAKHIRANVVSPGMVYFKGGIWHRTEQGMPQVYEANLSRNPMGRMATPQEIANAVVFLASPCSSYTTGINMIVDGALIDRVNY